MLTSFALSKRASARSIAVIGGGASGALIAAHVLKCADDDAHLTLIEPRAQIGRGLAYATENESPACVGSRSGALGQTVRPLRFGRLAPTQRVQPGLLTDIGP
jgi:hypothetical protein